MVNLARHAVMIAAAAILAASLPAPASADDECLNDPESQLIVGNGDTIALRPGASAKLWLNCRRCCWIDGNVDVPVAWSLKPGTTAATLDARTGALTIAAAAPVGSQLTVIAELTVRGKKRRVEGRVLVIDPRPQPWAGLWSETSRLLCASPGKAGGPDPTPAEKAPLIRELMLNEDGTFTVTWFPFERYKDYWGSYAVDGKTGAVTFTVTGGNSVPPPGADLTGTLRIEPGVGLVLSDLYLGAPSNAKPPRACGHRFGG
jgi:hypothetical protein